MNEIIVETIESTCVVTLNRPDKRNALNDDLIAALKAALREADADDSLCAVVIHGAGKDFCIRHPATAALGRTPLVSVQVHAQRPQERRAVRRHSPAIR